SNPSSGSCKWRFGSQAEVWPALLDDRFTQTADVSGFFLSTFFPVGQARCHAFHKRAVTGSFSASPARKLCYACCGKVCPVKNNNAGSKPPRRVREDCMTISRRNFARLAAASGAAAVASPAIAQGSIKWRLASSFPKSIELLWGASPTVAKYVNEMSDGKFTIDPFAAGEIVPGLQVLDAVANGTVECGHSYGGYYIGKNPTLIFDGSLPFGIA